MAYTKTAWINDALPAVNATNLNKMEQGIYDAHQAIAALPTSSDFKLLQDIVVTGADAATVDFTAIPQTYKHLRVVAKYVLATSNNNWLLGRINGLSSDIYGGQIDGSHNVSVQNQNYHGSGWLIALAWNLGWFELQIQNYRDTVFAPTYTSQYGNTYEYATVPAPSSADGFEGGVTNGYVAGAANVGPINRFTISHPASSIKVGSRFSLYGLA